MNSIWNNGYKTFETSFEYKQKFTEAQKTYIKVSIIRGLGCLVWFRLMVQGLKWNMLRQPKDMILKMQNKSLWDFSGQTLTKIYLFFKEIIKHLIKFYLKRKICFTT